MTAAIHQASDKINPLCELGLRVLAGLADNMVARRTQADGSISVSGMRELLKADERIAREWATDLLRVSRDVVARRPAPRADISDDGTHPAWIPLLKEKALRSAALVTSEKSFSVGDMLAALESRQPAGREWATAVLAVARQLVCRAGAVQPAEVA
jgi:hypothetical protein